MIEPSLHGGAHASAWARMIEARLRGPGREVHGRPDEALVEGQAAGVDAGGKVGGGRISAAPPARCTRKPGRQRGRSGLPLLERAPTSDAWADQRQRTSTRVAYLSSQIESSLTRHRGCRRGRLPRAAQQGVDESSALPLLPGSLRIGPPRDGGFPSLGSIEKVPLEYASSFAAEWSARAASSSDLKATVG
jgi:hypothetical protein